MEEPAVTMDETGPDASIELLRQILDHLSDQPSPAPAQGRSAGRPQEAPRDGEEVLDVELNGQRYTLIRSQAQPARPAVTLSPRECEIVRLVAKGHCNKTIALVLDISAWTVATHLRRIFAKLEVSSRAEMVARALQDGLLADDATVRPGS